MEFEKTDCITIVGRRGCGKTTLSRRVQSNWAKQVVLDPVGEYSDGLIFNSLDSFSKKMIELKENNAQAFRLIFRFNPENEDHETMMNAVLRVCYAFGNLQVVIEEVQYFTTTGKIAPYLKTCLFMGRHKGLSMVFVTQRPGQLNKNILSQSRHVFAGSLHDQNDIGYLANFLGPEFSKQLPNLKIGDFIYFTPGEEIKIVKNK